jgi:pimeloyl-ACP methyl ester carboxylesterase
MMPFSVLRILGLGLFSWLLLGFGIYLAYESYQRFSTPNVIEAREGLRGAEANDRELAERNLGDRIARAEAEAPGRTWKDWAILAGAIFCLTISFLGFLPASALLGNASGKDPVDIVAQRTLNIDRPDGTRLFVQISGKSEGPTLLMTHGWSLDSSAWKYLHPELSSHFRIVTWDLPGLGRSTAPDSGNFSLEKLAGDLDSVIRVVSPESPVVLIGHSIGGMIQQTFCRLHREQLGESVKGIVLVHTTYKNPIYTNIASGLTIALEKPLIVPLNYLMIALAPLFWLSNWQSYLNGSAHTTSRLTSFSGKQTKQQLDHGARLGAAAWPGVLARGNLAMLQFHEESTLLEIPVPVLVVRGEHDRMTVPEAGQYIEKLLPKATGLAINGGHLGYWEVSEEVAKPITRFAKSCFSGDSDSFEEDLAESDRDEIEVDKNYG